MLCPFQFFLKSMNLPFLKFLMLLVNLTKSLDSPLEFFYFFLELVWILWFKHLIDMMMSSRLSIPIVPTPLSLLVMNHLIQASIPIIWIYHLLDAFFLREFILDSKSSSSSSPLFFKRIWLTFHFILFIKFMIFDQFTN